MQRQRSAALFAILLTVASALALAQGGRGGGAPLPPAGPVPRTDDGKPDLRGNWDGSGGAFTHTVILEQHPGGFGILAGHTLIVDPPSGIVPYQAWALDERERRRDDANGYEDPVGHCEFYDIGRLHQFAQEILYANGDVYINLNQHITRRISMTRREHLHEDVRLWLGDSIGKWDGDTLVVETTNFNDKTRMAIGGDFHGPEAVTVERYTMTDSNTINWTMTITNPKVFTRPWTITSAVPMGRRPVRTDFDAEDTCHEGNLDLIHLKNVYDQAHGRGVPVLK